MNEKNELCFCKVCAKETQHVLVLVRKENVFNDAKNSKKKNFIVGLIKGFFLGPFVASMDEFSRHLICKQCGDKIIEE